MSKSLILFVDDETETLELLKRALEDRGYAMLTAKSGSEALDLLKTKTPDLILADLRMQPMNGFELFQLVKKNAKFSKTPFFFLTAVNDPLSQKYGETLGADAYITKPVDIDRLDTLIANRLPPK